MYDVGKTDSIMVEAMEQTREQHHLKYATSSSTAAASGDNNQPPWQQQGRQQHRPRRSSVVVLASPSPMHNDARTTLLNWIDSKPIGALLFVLLLVDIGLIFVDLFLDGYYPKCSYILRDARCTTTLYYGQDDDMYVVEASGSTPTCQVHGSMDAIREGIEVVSYCILCLFLLETIVMVGVLGPSIFFRNWIHTFDFGIVVSSFLLDSVSLFFDETQLGTILEDVVGFLIVGRLVKFATLSFDLIKIEREEESLQLESLQEQIHDLLQQQSVLLAQHQAQQQSQTQHDNNNSINDSVIHAVHDGILTTMKPQPQNQQYNHTATRNNTVDGTIINDGNDGYLTTMQPPTTTTPQNVQQPQNNEDDSSTSTGYHKLTWYDDDIPLAANLKTRFYVTYNHGEYLSNGSNIRKPGIIVVGVGWRPLNIST